MSEPFVEDLRQQLRERGYLSHGVERWFAHDPWSSRTFWLELLTLATKAATLIALFVLIPLSTVMVLRNHPLSAWETLVITLLYGALAFAVAFALLVAMALLLRGRLDIAIDTPRALLAISFLGSALLTAPIAAWWLGFASPPALLELLIGAALITLEFLAATTVISAALLSFSIHEVHRVPAIHRTSRSVPMTFAAMTLIALLFVPAYGSQERGEGGEPLQIITIPTDTRVAFLAIDGLTLDVLRAHPSLAATLRTTAPSRSMTGHSPPERWASIGTGVPPSLHGVRSVEGLRVRGGTHVLQSVSHRDVALRAIGEAVGITRRQPLPPTVRRRDYVWELFAHRAVPSLAVNWWTSEDSHSGGLESISQATVFARASASHPDAGATALLIDVEAAHILKDAIDRSRPRFATVYLPSLDIVLNRLALDLSGRLALSARAVERIEVLIRELTARGYEVVLLGNPGEQPLGSGVIGWTLRNRCCDHATAEDLAPTLCVLMGFPPSEEMSGRSLIAGSLPRVRGYGRRHTSEKPAPIDQEYYRSLRSLGYVR